MCFMFFLLITTLINASKYFIRSSKCGTMHVSDATFIHIMQDYRGPGFVHIHGGGSTGGLSAYGSMPYTDTAGMYTENRNLVGSCCVV